MGGSGFSREKYNAREQYLTADNNRLQALASRDLQNLLADASSDATGAPISGLSGPCSLTGIPSTYLMALSAAQALVYNPSDSSLTADDSAYEVARWAAANLTFANPSGANPRIDLVVVTPAMVDTDSQSRTVLVDPVARTVTPQNVFKTTNPQATVAVVTGTPASSPVPPAVPAGAFALFEVFVPTSASDSTAFGVCPRMFRRAPFPWSAQSGILSGFTPQWDLSVDPTTTDSTISFGALDDCKVLIDGEVLETLGVTLEVFQDAGANNPFASAAAAHWHKPYYLYAVGGRHCPQRGTALGAPVVIVESTIPPFATTGHPTSAITTPRGKTTQLGAVYIGLGFVYANTTRRLACVMDGEFTDTSGNNATGIGILTHVAGSAGVEAFDVNAPPVVPLISSRVKVQFFPPPTVVNTSQAYPDNGLGTGPVPGFSGALDAGQMVPAATSTTGAGGQGVANGILSVNPSAPKFWVAVNAGSGTSLLVLQGFEHKVRRLHY
jgi:hypothetical protein